jgi:very-short-patch-repair endonuclease
MKFLHQNRSLKYNRIALRSNMTPQEEKLWKFLRKKGLGYRFNRQHSIGPYIVDFYCAEKKLVIEIDGNHHSEKENVFYDNERSDFLENYNYAVLRFWNSGIDGNMNEVLEKIKNALT